MKITRAGSTIWRGEQLDLPAAGKNPAGVQAERGEGERGASKTARPAATKKPAADDVSRAAVRGRLTRPNRDAKRYVTHRQPPDKRTFGNFRRDDDASNPKGGQKKTPPSALFNALIAAAGQSILPAQTARAGGKKKRDFYFYLEDNFDFFLRTGNADNSSFSRNFSQNSFFLPLSGR